MFEGGLSVHFELVLSVHFEVVHPAIFMGKPRLLKPFKVTPSSIALETSAIVGLEIFPYLSLITTLF